jgi:hypothetical protein
MSSRKILVGNHCIGLIIGNKGWFEWETHWGSSGVAESEEAAEEATIEAARESYLELAEIFGSMACTQS